MCSLLPPAASSPDIFHNVSRMTSLPSSAQITGTQSKALRRPGDRCRARNSKDLLLTSGRTTGAIFQCDHVAIPYELLRNASN